MLIPSESVRLSVGGVTNAQWTGWSVDSDLLVPSDAFELELFSTASKPLPQEVIEGAPCELQLGDDTVLTGRIDEIEQDADRRGHTLRINGRDLAGTLVDCSAPFVSLRDASLQQIIDQAIKPLGITRVRIASGKTDVRRRVQIQPGQTAWDALQQVAEASGVWPWVEPDGTLVVGVPDYSTPSVGHLLLRHTDSADNNIERLSVRRSIVQRFSEITVLGQHGSFDGDDWGAQRVALKSQVKDDALARRGIFRPRIVVDGNCESQQRAKARADTLLADSKMAGFEMRAVVAGWRASSGAVWTPGQRVEVISEPHGIDGVYFLMGRKLRLTRRNGSVSELNLREDKAWIIGQNEKATKRKRKKAGDAGDQYL